MRPKKGISSGLGTEHVQIAPHTSPWEHNPYGSGYLLSVERSKVDQVLEFGGGEPISGEIPEAGLVWWPLFSPASINGVFRRKKGRRASLNVCSVPANILMFDNHNDKSIDTTHWVATTFLEVLCVCYF